MDTCKAMYLCLFKVTAQKHLSRKSWQKCLLEQKLPENLQVEYILFGNLNFLKTFFVPSTLMSILYTHVWFGKNKICFLTK